MLFSIKKLQKAFNGNKVLGKLDLNIKKSKIIAFLGPNGCGKSTLFNILANTIKKDKGEINREKISRFKFSYAFQNYRETLLPWKNNYNNLAFPLQIQRFSKKDIEKRVHEICKLASFNLNLNLYPYELSGGQQQILAFFRSLITKPEVILLDEPFSALDYDNTLKMMSKLQDYYLQNKSTILVITHDVDEALYLADEIVVLSKKPSKVLGTIKNKISRPRNLNTIKSKEFHKTKTKVLKLFEKAIK